MYEVCIESTMQLFLQTGILLFNVFLTTPGTYEFQDDSSYILDIISITTSISSLLWGLSSFKINVTQKEQSNYDKFVLMVRSSVDIIGRYDHFIINSLFITYLHLSHKSVFNSYIYQSESEIK